MKTKPVIVGKQTVGGKNFALWAGPCAVESLEQFQAIAKFVKLQGGNGLRGGIYKLRTNPKSFQGLGSEACPFVNKVKKSLDLPFITEITDPRQIEILENTADVYQVGTRNMFNYELLKELGQSKKPVLLKRNFSARIKEWILAADYLVKWGNSKVILCERGIRTFETETRNTLDYNAVAYIKQHTSFPIIVDPSHGSGSPELIPSLSKAAVAVGADGLLIEVHNEPEKALCDGHQALTFNEFSELVKNLKAFLSLTDKQELE